MAKRIAARRAVAAHVEPRQNSLSKIRRALTSIATTEPLVGTLVIGRADGCGFEVLGRFQGTLRNPRIAK